MPDQFSKSSQFDSKSVWLLTAVGSTIAIVMLWPHQAWGVIHFVVQGLLSVAPLVILGIVLAAWIMASGANAPIARSFEGKPTRAIVAASMIGAVTPVCGVTVLPMMAGLLAAGIPLAPVMTFWLSSPITDPAMLATTAATLGINFAVGKTLAAFALGLWGGFITVTFSKRGWVTAPLRDNNLVGRLANRHCQTPLTFNARIWVDESRRIIFRQNTVATTRLILICLIPAFAAEYALNATLQPEALAGYVGKDVWWAIPLAVVIGAPAYLDGYAALPLTRSLMEHGMSAGAAMAFLVSGGAVSIWGAIAIFPVLKLKPFVLYLALAVSGSIAAGYAFGLVA